MDQEEIELLRRSTGAVLLQTHISWLFLTGDFVYKIKKPVKFSFLDFSTLRKRKFYCKEEVRLNRRLSADIYLGVVPVVKNDSNYYFGGKGIVIDHAVKMAQLPQDGKMDSLLLRNKVTREHIKAIASIVAAFHKRIPKIKGQKYSSPSLVKEQIDDLAGVKEIIERACGIGHKVDFILQKCDYFIGQHATIMKKRQKEGKVRDCHGDLHSANIFIINDKIYIFDCIEFNKFFRYIDVASEIAFMAMDLDAFGREDLSRLFVSEYIKLTQDTELLDLLNLYKCYRANVRAKVAALAFAHDGLEGQKENIEKYMALCESYARLL